MLILWYGYIFSIYFDAGYVWYNEKNFEFVEELKMHYRIERYKNCKRFNDQYQDIYSFLLNAEKIEYKPNLPHDSISKCP